MKVIINHLIRVYRPVAWTDHRGGVHHSADAVYKTDKNIDLWTQPAYHGKIDNEKVTWHEELLTQSEIDQWNRV